MVVRSTRVLTTLCFVVVAVSSMFSVFAAEAQSKDSLAPKTAGDRWLPCEPWVMYHWNPLDMPKFYERTGIRQTELYRWMRDDDHHTFAGVLESQGLDPEKVIADSLATTVATTPRMRATLKARAERLLTQGHLAQHVFFHWFHNPSIRQHSRAIYSMAPWDYARARRMGFTPAQIGSIHNGFSRKETANRIVEAMMRDEQRGVRAHQTTASQAAHYRERIVKLADTWLDQRYRKPKQSGPLPHPLNHHDSHLSSVTCRDFVGAGQPRDRYTKISDLHAQQIHASKANFFIGFCPLAIGLKKARSAGSR